MSYHSMFPQKPPLRPRFLSHERAGAGACGASAGGLPGLATDFATSTPFVSVLADAAITVSSDGLVMLAIFFQLVQAALCGGYFILNSGFYGKRERVGATRPAGSRRCCCCHRCGDLRDVPCHDHRGRVPWGHGCGRRRGLHPYLHRHRHRALPWGLPWGRHDLPWDRHDLPWSRHDALPCDRLGLP